MGRKICVYCNKRKNIKSFPKHSGHLSGVDTRCRSCIKKNAKLTNRLKKKSPPKPIFCECCGVKHPKICFDHDHDHRWYRGWLCDPCNTSIGKLGDNIEGISNVLSYLFSSIISKIPKRKYKEEKFEIEHNLKNIFSDIKKLEETILLLIKQNEPDISSKTLDNADTCGILGQQEIFG